MKKVSVIIPVCNSIMTIRQCLDSVRIQTYKNLEILLIQDVCTDETSTMTYAYEKADDRITVYQYYNGSAAVARNRGLELSSGDYIFFMDSDDELANKYVIEKMVNKLEDEAADIVISDYSRLIRGEKYKAEQCKAFMKYDADSVRFCFSAFFSVGNMSYVWAKLYRRAFIDKNKLKFEEVRYGEDKLFNMEAYLCSPKFAYAVLNSYTYRMNPNSLSFTYKYDNYKSWLAIAHCFDEYLIRKGKKEKYAPLTGYTLSFAAFFDTKNEYVHYKKTKRFGAYGAMRKMLKIYAEDELGRESFKMLARGKGIKDIDSLFYRLALRFFGILMTTRSYNIIALGIKLIIALDIDEKLSDTGKR